MKIKKNIILFFQNTENNKILEESFNKYVTSYKIEGDYACDIEFSAICKLLKINLIIFIKGFRGLNVYNIYTRENLVIAEPNTIYILYINNNRLNYLQLISKENEEINSITQKIYNLIKINLKEWKNIRKR